MAALAILTCRQNSHPFQERHISLHEPVKIGRSVARARPGPSNGIFDCKVLSRNHAMLWYENGIFYLQDTKSSNGTFINDQRLCKGGEESAPRESYSGDVIQFGVNVMENNRRGEKITHGCIIATITLYHPDGREAKPVLYNTPTPGITIQSQELYKLAQYLQEALHREKMLEQKLSTLQELVQNTQESSEGGWQALIDEDRLLSRLEVLENQLHVYSKNHAEDTLRQELVTLQEEKLNYESTAKDSLMKVLQEKIEAVTKLSDLEKSLKNAEEECTHLKDSCEKTQDELQLLAEKYQDQLKEVQDLQIQLQDAESKHQDDVEKIEKEKTDLTEKINDMVKKETTLIAKVESLQVNADITTEQFNTIRAKLDKFKDVNEDENDNNLKILDTDQEKLVNSDNEVIIPTSVDKDKDELPEDVEGKLKETQQQIEVYKTKLEDSEKHLKDSGDKVEQLQKELEAAKTDSQQYLDKITALEGQPKPQNMPDVLDKLKLSELTMNQMMESTMVDLKMQLSESTKQSDSSNDLIKNLQNQICDLEQELSIYKIPQPEKALDVTLVGRPSLDGRASLDEVDSSSPVNHIGSQKDDEELNNLLEEARELQKKAEEELSKCKDDLEDSQLLAKKTGEENSALKTELEKAQETITEKSGMVIDLQDQLQKAEATTQEVKEQILTLRDQLVEEQELSKKNLEEINSLKSEIDGEKKKHKDTQDSLDETKKLLTEAQQTAKQSHNEAEHLRNKLKHHEDSDVVHRREKHEKRESHTPVKHSHHTPDTKHPAGKPKASEFTALKEECASLRKRIQAIEAEMKMSRRENLQLSSEYNKLQESYKQLEALKSQLEDKQVTWMSNLTDSQKETENTKLELEKAKEEIVMLQKKCDECDQEITRLKSDLKKMSGDYGKIATRSRIISFCSSIPLLMLLFAVLLALYPTLELLTATAT